jgi:hypothetical protein
MATLKFVQAQKFSLSGSGASIGDTTITLQSMLGINGTAITTTDIGTAGFGTIEPGNGTQEEAIKFTGITQNSNGTATLTGVSSVLFISPYTATSGLSKTHAGATTFILSNDAAFYGAILDYVDNSLMASGIPATNLVAGISKLSVAAVSAANPIVVGDNDTRMLASGTALYVGGITNTSIPYVVATGTTQAYTATLASSVSSLASGTYIHFLAPSTNASSVTLNVNGLGAKTIKKPFSSSLASGEILTGQVTSVVYDGTSFQLQNQSQVGPIINTYITSGTWTKPAGLKYVIAEVVGGGGGASSSSASSGGAGAGGGGYSRKKILATTLGTTETVSVGGGGASTVNGGTTSFGAHCSATGGNGATANTAPGNGGSGSSGDLNTSGSPGTGLVVTNGYPGGSGGGSYYGGGGAGSSSNGSNGGNYGGGGGAGYNTGTGGVGAPGICIVTEYY